MLAAGISAGVSKRISYGTIYTTKLLRRGTDIERPRPASLLQTLTVGETMKPIPHGDAVPIPLRNANANGVDGKDNPDQLIDGLNRLGALIDIRTPPIPAPRRNP